MSADLLAGVRDAQEREPWHRSGTLTVADPAVAIYCRLGCADKFPLGSFTGRLANTSSAAFTGFTRAADVHQHLALAAAPTAALSGRYASPDVYRPCSVAMAAGVFGVRIPPQAPSAVQISTYSNLLGLIAMLGRKKVLLVDDEVDAVGAMSLLLGLEGYEVRAAGSGTEALQIVETFVPDVALIDEKMPQMSGLELAAVLHGYAALSGMKMVALSGFGQAANVQRAKDAGFDFHLTKPVTIDDVIEAIEKQ